MTAMRLCRLIFVMVSVIVAIAAAWQTRLLPPPQFEPVGSALVPRITAALVAAIALIAGLPFLRQPVRGTGSLPGASRRGAAFVGLFSLYALLLVQGAGGFGLLTALYLAGAYALHERRLRHWLIGALAMTAFAFALEYLFTQVFVIDLPRSF